MRVMHERSGTPSATRARALVVDPNPADRASAAHWLLELGYDVRQAADFAHARALLDVPPAAIVTALRLGAYNGFHLIIVARSGGHRVAAVVVTEHDDSATRAEAARLRVGYVVKPLTRESLGAILGESGQIGRACER
jgi:DNA-binding response OmpR family regulator